MRLLVLGATGHVGQAVVRRALESGDAVTAVTRRADPPALRGLQVTVVRIDDGFHALPALALGHDVIVDAAAPYPLEPCLRGSHGWRRVIEEAVRRARQVIEAAASNRSRLVLISSFTTLPRNDSPLRGVETAWRRAAYPYFEAKAAMEQAVVEAAERGLEAVIVNPAACLGPWEFRADGSSLVRLILQRQLPVVMDQALSVIDVRDVAEAIDRALARGFFGRPIALAGHNVGLADLVGEIRAMSGITGSDPLPIDPILAATAAFWTSTAFAAFNQNASNIWRAVPLIADSFPMQPSPEQLAMDLNPRPLSVTLGDAIAFHRSWRPH